MAKFLDLSNNNNVRSFASIKKAGYQGVILKVSEGATFVDPKWKDYSARARRNGLAVGGYHYAFPGGGDVEAEAAHFVRNLGKIRELDYRPVLDFEINPHHLEDQALEDWARAWVRKVRDLTGVLPLFYSYPWFIQNLHIDKAIGAGLWLASYGPNDGKEHPYTIPFPWKKVVAHQFTSNGRVAGVDGDVDVNRVVLQRPLWAYPDKVYRVQE